MVASSRACACENRELSLQQIGANVSSVLDPDSVDASDSGVRVRDDASRADGTAPPRSAHYTRLTILARTGLPGAGLWVLLWPVWFRHVVHWGIRRGRGGWTANAGLSALVLAAVVGYLANTYFDPSWMAQRALSGSGASWHWERVRSQEPLDRNEPPSCQPRRPAG